MTLADVGLVAAREGAVVCNGSELLCERRFDDVAYATTHNAMAARFDPYIYSLLISNQCSGVPTQLEDGIRGLMLDIHLFAPPEAEFADLYLCHSDCDFGAQLLVDGLAEVRAFLDEHPGEIVTFIIETNSDTAPMEAEIRDDFVESGLVSYAHVQTPGATVADARRDGRSRPAPRGAHRRLLAADRLRRRRHSLPLESPSVERLRVRDALPGEQRGRVHLCRPSRRAGRRPLHPEPLPDPVNIGLPRFARQVNFDPLLSRRARECWAYQGQIPNFPTVDFYEIGRVVRTTNLLNFLWGQGDGAGPP